WHFFFPAPHGPRGEGTHGGSEEDLRKGIEDDLEKRGYKPLSGELDKLVKDPSFTPQATQVHVLLGKAAPGFTLLDTDGIEWSMPSRKPGLLVLVFYYGYGCDHCVSQLFALSKDLPRFRALGAEVVAVSADPREDTVAKFKQYGAFAFPVLS